VDLTKQIPAIATLANAAAGVLACACAVNGRPEVGALLILAAVLMDSVDGALARSLGAASDFGAELDSLADAISFGVAPAVLVGALVPVGLRHLGWALATAYALCAAWRLARFNTSQNGAAESHADFIGLPSTGAGAAAAAAVLMHARLAERGLLLWPMLLPCILVLLGALMVSRIPYKHIGAVISRLRPGVAVAFAVTFVAASVLWEHEYLFGTLMWGYALSGPLATAREAIRAVRHA